MGHERAAWGSVLLSVVLLGCRAPVFRETELVHGLRAASEVAEAAPAWRVSECLAEIAVAQARLGDVEGALRTAGRMGEEAAATRRVQRAIAVAQVRQGQVRAARRTAGAIARADGRDGVLCGVAVAQVAAGDVSGGLRTAKRLGAAGNVTGWAAMGRGLAAAGEMGHARESFAKALGRAAGLPAPERPDALREVAEAQRQAGEEVAAQSTLREAVAAAEALPDASRGTWALQRLAVAQAAGGQVEEARATFGKALALVPGISGPYAATNRQRAVEGIAEAQASAGLIEDALRTVRRAGREYNPVLAAVCKAQLAADDLEGALQTSLRLWAPEVPAAAEPRPAVEVVWVPSDERDVLLVDVARAHAEHGKVREALSICGRVGCPSRRAEAVLAVATVQARKGDVAAAIETAEGITFLQYRTPFLHTPGARFRWDAPETWGLLYTETDAFTGPSRRCQTRAARDLAGAAMRFEQTVGSPSGRDYRAAFDGLDEQIVRELARVHAEESGAGEALAWCLDLSDPYRRVEAVLGVADAVAGGEP